MRPPVPAHGTVVFLVDTLRADHLGAYGHSRPTSPRFDRLAEEALLFERAIAPCSWTKPSVASVFTSLLPSDHGVETDPDALAPNVPTLAERFRDAGMRTAGFGANGWVFGSSFGLGRGFERFDFLVNDPRDPTDVSSRSDQVVDEALVWLEENAQSPFLLYVHTIDPHAPYAAPAEEHARFVGAEYGGPLTGRLQEAMQLALQGRLEEEDVRHLAERYEAEIAYNDRQLGRLIDGLRELGVWDRTTFAFLSDHGEEFWEHGWLGHGRMLNQVAVHVPLLVKPPASLGLGAERYSQPVSLLDVAPTLCELAGVDAGGFTGRSLLDSEARHSERVVVSERRHADSFEVRVERGARNYRARFGEVFEEAADDPSDPTPGKDVWGNGAPLAAPGVDPELDALREVAWRRFDAAQRGFVLEFFAGDEPRNVQWTARIGGAEPDLVLQDTEVEDSVDVVAGEDSHELRGTFTVAAGDRDAVVLRIDGPVELDVRVDGEPLPTRNLVLGAAQTPTRKMPLLVLPGDAALAANALEQPMPEVLRGLERQVLVRIWIRGAERAEMAEDVEASLRALGYLGD